MSSSFPSWKSYFWPPPHDTVLKNKFEERHGEVLKALEYSATAARQVHLESRKISILHTYDGMHLKAIHGYLFQDVYEWAGEYRTVPLAKGSPVGFAEPDQIDRYLDDAQSIIGSTAWGRLDRKGFSKAAAEVFAYINQAHPFREGNGRTAKIFMEHVAEQSLFTLDYARVTPQVWNQASHLSSPDYGTYQPVATYLVPVFYALAQPR
jgi:cell filamentation protein